MRPATMFSAASLKNRPATGQEEVWPTSPFLARVAVAARARSPVERDAHSGEWAIRKKLTWTLWLVNLLFRTIEFEQGPVGKVSVQQTVVEFHRHAVIPVSQNFLLQTIDGSDVERSSAWMRTLTLCSERLFSS